MPPRSDAPDAGFHGPARFADAFLFGQLSLAAGENDAKSIRSLAARKPELLSMRGPEDLTALSIAVKAGSFSAVEALLALGADPLSPEEREADGSHRTPLYFAACASHEKSAQIFSLLADQTGDEELARQQSGPGFSLAVAALRGAPQIVARILSALDSREELPRSELAKMANKALVGALIRSEAADGVDCVKLLLPFAQMELAEEGFVAACVKSGCIQRLRLVLGAGADAKKVDDSGLSTPLMLAAARGFRPDAVEWVRALLPLSDARAKSRSGNTAMHFAALASAPRANQTLSDQNAGVILRELAPFLSFFDANDDGKRPLDLLVEWRPAHALACVLPLIDPRRITEKRRDGSDALDVALQRERWEHADLLLPAWPPAAAERAFQAAAGQGDPAQLLPRSWARREADEIHRSLSRQPAASPADARAGAKAPRL